MSHTHTTVIVVIPGIENGGERLDVVVVVVTKVQVRVSWLSMRKRRPWLSLSIEASTKLSRSWENKQTSEPALTARSPRSSSCPWSHGTFFYKLRVRPRGKRSTYPAMPLNIPLRKKISAGEPAAGAWLTLPSTAIARTIASTKNVSWVLIDGEHGLINECHFYDLANVIAASGASPLVRVPAEEAWLIKRALDSGAHGLMVPMANSTEIVRKVVQATKYPPHGIRGYGPMFTHATGQLGGSYKESANEDLLVAVQIEHPNAVKEIEDIVKEDIDIAFIGPFDLAVSMGVEFGGVEHEAAISKILDACKKAGKAAAIFCLNGEQAAKRFTQGFDMVSVTTDIDTLTDGFAAALHSATAENVSFTAAAGSG